MEIKKASVIGPCREKFVGFINKCVFIFNLKYKHS